MTFEQGEKIIELLELIAEYFYDFQAVVVVDTYNVLVIVSVIIISILSFIVVAATRGVGKIR